MNQDWAPVRIRPKTGSKKADVSAAVRSGGTVVAEKKRTFLFACYRVHFVVVLVVCLLFRCSSYDASSFAARGGHWLFQSMEAVWTLVSGPRRGWCIF